MKRDNTLIATVGLPRAGKTTWIEDIHERHGWPVLEVDAFRHAIHGTHFSKPAEPIVWSHVRIAVRAIFGGHHDVAILDSTMITQDRRRKFEDENFDVAFKEFHTSVEKCIARAEETDQEYLIPVIRRMDKARDPLGVDDLHFEDWYELYQNHEKSFEERAGSM